MRTFTIMLLLAVATCALAQTTTTVTPAAPATTSVFISVGGEYNHYTTPALAASTLEVGVCGKTVCSITTLEQQTKSATIRTGFGYKIPVNSGRLSLYGTMDAGATFSGGTATATTVAALAATSTVYLGNLGGGMRVRFDLGGLSLGSHTIPPGIGVVVGVRMAAVSGTSVQPEYMGALSYRFGAK